MGILVGFLVVLLVTVHWVQYRNSIVYKARLEVTHQAAIAQQQYAAWSLALRDTTDMLSRVPELKARAATILRDQVLAPRRSAVLAVDNLRQFKGIGKDTVSLLLAGGFASADRINPSITRLPGIGTAKAERILAAAAQLKGSADSLQPTDHERAEVEHQLAAFTGQLALWAEQVESVRADLATTVDLWRAAQEQQTNLSAQLGSYTFLRFISQRSTVESEVVTLMTTHNVPLPAVVQQLPQVSPPPSPPKPSKPPSPQRSARETPSAPLPSPSQRFVEVRPTPSKPSLEPVTVQVRLNQRSPFITASQRYRTMKPTPALHVPFQQYWPTFGHLSQSQLAYYVWWRSEWLAGRFVQVDLSYVFLFVYELLNFSFEPQPHESFEILARVFESYREVFPTLWNYAEWVGDLAWELGLKDQALAWYERDDTTLDVALSLGQGSGQMLLSGAVLLNTFRQRRSAYFSQNENAVLTLMDEAIQHASEWCKTSKGSTLLETLAGGRVERSTRALYPSAVIERQLIRTGPTYQLLRANQAISDGVQALARLVENTHRQSTGNRRLLHVVNSSLPPGLAEYLLERLTPTSIAPSSPSIEFDATLVSQIRHDSNETQALLAQMFTDTADEEQPSVPEAREAGSTDRTAEPILSQPATIPASGLESIFVRPQAGSMVDLFGLLDPLQVTFLHHFADSSSLEKATAVAFMREHGVMLVSFMEGINEAALDPLGDLLLEEDDETIQIAEGFVDQLQAYWRQKEVNHPC